MTAMAVAHSDHAPKVYGPYSRGMAVGLADPASAKQEQEIGTTGHWRNCLPFGGLVLSSSTV